LKLIVQCLSNYLFFVLDLIWISFSFLGEYFFFYLFCFGGLFLCFRIFEFFVSLFWLLYAIKLLIETFHALLYWIRFFSVFRWWELWIGNFTSKFIGVWSRPFFIAMRNRENEHLVDKQAHCGRTGDWALINRRRVV